MLVINGSPRKDGNTEIMADAFIRGAEENGNTAVKINLSEVSVGPCKACEYCFAHDNTCVQQDGMTEIFAQMDQADLIVFASPIYFSGLSAQLVAVIDRLYARCRVGYHPTCSVLLLNSGSPNQYAAAIAQYKDMLEDIGWEDKGIVAISGMEKKGSMADIPELEKVLALGRSIR